MDDDYGTMATADLVRRLTERLAPMAAWTPDQRYGVVDAEAGAIIDALEARGYRDPWATWVETGVVVVER